MSRNRMDHGARRAALGFTLLEMIIVVSIIGLLAALILPRLAKTMTASEIGVTKAQIEQVATSVQQFRNDVGRFPTEQEGLRSLIEAPAGVDNWRGPYLEKRTLPKDGWKRELIYKTDKDYEFKIVSLGADGKEGGEGADADLDNRT